MKDQKLKIQGSASEISNTEKNFYPKAKITKGNVLDYYENISKIILPHLKDRLLVFDRYPNGIEYQHFVQQEVPDYFPKWMDRKRVAKEEGGYITHAICNDKKSLLYLVQEAVLEFHTWLSRVDKIKNPDKLVFDLDPTGTNIDRVREGALFIKNILDELEIKSYVMTTGGRGYHIVIPLDRKMDFNKAHMIAERIAKYIANKNKDLFSADPRKSGRRGKVFVDYVRNSYGLTEVCPYSLRAKEGASIATPVTWDEMKSKRMSPQKYTIKNILRRISQKGDPWKDIYKNGQSLKKIEKKLKF